jgi:hypothetical protein
MEAIVLMHENMMRIKEIRCTNMDRELGVSSLRSTWYMEIYVDMNSNATKAKCNNAGLF